MKNKSKDKLNILKGCRSLSFSDENLQSDCEQSSKKSDSRDTDFNKFVFEMKTTFKERKDKKSLSEHLEKMTYLRNLLILCITSWQLRDKSVMKMHIMFCRTSIL